MGSIPPPLPPPCICRFALSLLSGVPSAFIPASLPPTLPLLRPCAAPATRPRLTTLRIGTMPNTPRVHGGGSKGGGERVDAQRLHDR